MRDSRAAVMRRLAVALGGLAVVVAGVALLLRSEPEPVVAAAPTVAPTTTTTSSTTTTTTSTTTTTTTTTTTPPPEPFAIPAVVPAHPSPPDPVLPAEWDGHGAATAAIGGADLASSAEAEPFHRLREGVVVAARGLSTDGEWVRIFHPCDGVAWIRASEIAVTPAAPDATIGAGFDFSAAVIIVDPGHGGPANTGAVSSRGVPEKGINVEIAARLRDLLSAPRSVDWETGQIFDGADIPAAGSVVVTRSGLGEAADYEAGLDFRAAVANSLNAHAMIAIHNNAGQELALDAPGSDVYYQSQAPLVDGSRRLAVLLVEEMRRGFDGFGTDWVGAIELGAKSRISPRDRVSQYYGVLKASEVPTVIAEGAYISNPAEAELLQTPEFQHAYAAAVYRALVRFLTTDEPGGAPSYDPEVWEGFAGSGGARPECVLPSQGE